MVFESIQKTLEECKIYGKGILVAVSGGVDSIVLLYVLNDLKDKFELELEVAHVNHSLRAESLDEEIFVSKLAESLGLIFHSIRLEPPEVKVGIEEWARKERYSFFKEIMCKKNILFCATAHTADDLAETVFMRLVRGSGIFGLRGIEILRSDGVFRPMLSVKKSEIYKFANAKSLKWYEDISNKDGVFFRNRVRNSIIPFFDTISPNTTEDLLHISYEMKRINNLIADDKKEWLKKYVTMGRYAFLICKEGLFDKKLIVTESLAELLRVRKISFDSLALDRIIGSRNKKTGEILLKNGAVLYPGKKKSVIEMERISMPSSVKLNISSITNFGYYRFECSFVSSENIDNLIGDNSSVFIDTELFSEPLNLKIPTKDSLFKPLGRLRDVSVIEFLKKRGVSRYFRDTIPVLTDSLNRVLWVPFESVSEDAKVTNRSSHILKITCSFCSCC